MQTIAINGLTGLKYLPEYFDRTAQEALLADVREVVAKAPLFLPVMPKTGKPFSVQMSNCGPLGWVSDINGYRYQPNHPVTGQMWPAIPARLLRALESGGSWRPRTGSLSYQLL